MKCSSSKNLLKKIGFLNAGSLTVFLFLAMLVSPDIVFTGAADGLLLWFNTIFPTLFPFMFITAILLKSGGLNIIANVLENLSEKYFPYLPQGHFLLLPDFYAVIRWVQKLPQILCVQKRSNARGCLSVIFL